MGPSGSGKSTLLNLVAGLDRPTSGAIMVGGERVDALSETGLARFRRRQIGMIFQFFNLLDDMTVSGAMVAGTRRIGVLKSLGFSPGQVVASYVIQVAIPALAGCLAGVVAGNLLSVPLLSQTAQVYGVGALAVPFWVDVAVPLAMLALAS